MRSCIQDGEGKSKKERHKAKQSAQTQTYPNYTKHNPTSIFIKRQIGRVGKKTGTNIKDPNSLMPITAEVDRHTEQERLAAGSGLRQALGHFRKSGCVGRDLCQWKRKSEQL